jgi:L-amino acid N-acyltransferase YncA
MPAAIMTSSTSVCLRNGVSVQVRSVHPDDRPAVLAFLTELSEPSRQMRFFTAAANLTTAASWAAGADGRNHLGLLALDDAGQIVAHAACCRVYGRRAEVAVEVSERSRHQGLATMLIAELARRAEALGIHAFIAEVLPQNHEMLAVFHDSFDATQSLHAGEVDIEFPTSAWRRADAGLAGLKASHVPCPDPEAHH